MKTEFVITRIEGHDSYQGHVIIHMEGYVQGQLCFSTGVIVPISQYKESCFEVGDKIDAEFTKEMLN